MLKYFRFCLLFAALALSFSVWASASGTFYGKSIEGQGYGGDFRLTDHNGHEQTLSNFRGKVVIIFFGYTRCPDFCPTTLSKLSEVMKQLGPKKSKVQVLFVTIDPHRDSEELLRNYVPQFDPSFLGLRGTDEETDKAANAFRVQYQIMEYQGQTLVDHTASGYLIDATGKTRLLLPYSMTSDQIFSDVSKILQE